MTRTRRIGMLAAASVVVAVGAPAAASAKTVGPGASGHQVSLGNTESLTIKLRPGDSASSGYHWHVAKRPSASVLRLASSRTTSDGARQVFTYKARGAGRTSLRLQYVPPGRGARAVRSFRLSVVVRTSGRGAPRSCSRRGSTVAQNGSVRVYEVSTRDGSSLRGCRRATGRSVELASASDDGFTSSSSYADVRLAGTFVAWSYTSTDSSCKADCPPGYDGTSQAIAVYDVVRRTTRTVDAYPTRSALVLSKFGAVAWAEQAAGGGPTEIHASTKTGEDRVIDSGNIDPGTLAIEITIISWTRDGEERFARLR